jgi:hypothetical protein
MSQNDLKPCPFCGNTTITELGKLPASYRPDLHEPATSLVQCGNCKATASGKQRWNERVSADTPAETMNSEYLDEAAINDGPEYTARD